jgi:2-methylcitrate dehydratase PrpD
VQRALAARAVAAVVEAIDMAQRGERSPCALWNR